MMNSTWVTCNVCIHACIYTLDICDNNLAAYKKLLEKVQYSGTHLRRTRLQRDFALNEKIIQSQIELVYFPLYNIPDTTKSDIPKFLFIRNKFYSPRVTYSVSTRFQ